MLTEAITIRSSLPPESGKFKDLLPQAAMISTTNSRNIMGPAKWQPICRPDVGIGVQNDPLNPVKD